MERKRPRLAGAADIMGRKVDAAVMHEVHRDAARRRHSKRQAHGQERQFDDDDDLDNDLDDRNMHDDDAEDTLNNGHEDVDANRFDLDGNGRRSNQQGRDAEVQNEASEGPKGEKTQLYRDRAAERRAGRGGLVDAVDHASEYASVVGPTDDNGEDFGHLKRGLDLDQVRKRREEIRREEEAAAQRSGAVQVSSAAVSIVHACLARNQRDHNFIRARSRPPFAPGALHFIYSPNERIPRLKPRTTEPIALIPLHPPKPSSLAWRAWSERSSAKSDNENVRDTHSGDAEANHHDHHHHPKNLAANSGIENQDDDDDGDIFSDVEEDYQIDTSAVLAKREQVETRNRETLQQSPTALHEDPSRSQYAGDKTLLTHVRDGVSPALDQVESATVHTDVDTSRVIKHVKGSSTIRPEIGPSFQDGGNKTAYPEVGPSMQSEGGEASTYPEVGPSSQDEGNKTAYPEVGPSMPHEGGEASAYPEVGPSFQDGEYNAYPEVGPMYEDDEGAGEAYPEVSEQD